MDIRTWQEADRVDDARDPDGPTPDPKAYRARHRSRGGVFSPLRPGPIAFGSLSTAAIAAFALVGPGVLHSSPAASGQPHVVDGMPQRLSRLTPGPAASVSAPSSGAPAANQGSTPSASASTAPSTPSAPSPSQPTPSTPPAAPATPAKQPTSAPSGANLIAPTPASTDGGPANSPVVPAPTPPSSAFIPAAPPSGGSSSPPVVAPVVPPKTPTVPVTVTPTTPTAPTTPTTPPPPAFNAAAAQQSALATITTARRALGNPALTVNSTLTTAAAQHSADMVKNNLFSHTGSDGTSPITRALMLGCWTFDKEVIARGNPGDDVMATLLKDPQSARAVLSYWVTTIGASAQQDPKTGQVVWTIELGWG